MSTARRLTAAVASAVFIALFCLAAYGNAFNNHRHLPLPTSINALSLLLPILQLIGCFYGVFAAAHKADVGLVVNFGYIFSLLDVALISTATVYHADQPLKCVLDDKWGNWFSTKNVKAISDIQDKLVCCGLHSTKDKAWPFPSARHGVDVDACVKQFDRHDECFPKLVGAAHKATTIFIVIGSISLAVKILAGFYWQVRNPGWTNAARHAGHWRKSSSQRSHTRLIGGAEEASTGAEEIYTDEEPAGSSNVAVTQRDST